MRIQMNSEMRKYLESQAMRDHLANVQLSSELQSIVESRIIETHGCYLLEGLLPQGFKIELALRNHVDRTELECSANELHIPTPTVPVSERDAWKILAQGYLCALRLGERLEEKGHFKVSLSFQNKELVSATVRFHKVRPGETWIVGNLEEYQLEALLAIDTVTS